MANLLAHESSPYLLQHANNPVNWRSWNDETLSLAKSQNKLMLISIGYSACHWCHVMEKQCFENQEAARIMNKYFICVKVDREERPDIDAVYMQALQLMSGQGGWPLNCFTLPDGRPVFGGTYFPLEKWMSVLENLQQLFETNLSAMQEYAERLMKGIQQTQIYKLPEKTEVDSNAILTESLSHWKKHFDLKDGGTQRVPKFPMPCNYLFLLIYGNINKEKELLSHVFTTLDKMSMGGIFDQLGGGFARYSTDGIWKVPHFEKMLYDNAQLVSLYSMAHQLTSEVNYKMIIEKTLAFVSELLSGDDGQFYSALDADSEGEEGKYYVWKNDELQNLLGVHFELFCKYYNVNELGYWEHENYILMRAQKDEEFCHANKINVDELIINKNKWDDILYRARQKRTAPGLDDKTLTSWNALMLKAYVDAYLALNNKDYLELAEKNANFILQHQIYDEKQLYHSYKNGKFTINGFLEDYAFTAQAFVALYAANCDEKWLVKAKILVDNAIENFYDEKDGLFYFNSIIDAPLITRQKEVQDNVIPSSNAIMAHVLFDLGIYFEQDKYIEMSEKMCAHFYHEITNYGSAYACWALLLLRLNMPVLQIAIPQKEYRETLIAIHQKYRINLFTYALHPAAALPFVEDKKDKEYFYVCADKVCSLPLNNQKELITAFENL
jgi:uncharacterized protein YyaL (SSP411 family)